MRSGPRGRWLRRLGLIPPCALLCLASACGPGSASSSTQSGPSPSSSTAAQSGSGSGRQATKTSLIHQLTVDGSPQGIFSVTPKHPPEPAGESLPGPLSCSGQATAHFYDGTQQKVPVSGQVNQDGTANVPMGHLNHAGLPDSVARVDWDVTCTDSAGWVGHGGKCTGDKCVQPTTSPTSPTPQKPTPTPQTSSPSPTPTPSAT